ncbi:unnamed protein product [Clonostachys rhizophaga]|uniref:DUF833-domain-containing protein n=1 Tax=Clonostachys rhizophaga TaxID=160324 RepID=A0A9N9UYG8_9HYPO|nr:unnamed protein product [Clonostachys rhizophaga]
MCIVFVTTAHPKYPVIVIDNRDEFILRPTSRPHWYKHPVTGEEVLSSRDLHRPEMGTWMGITKSGLLAVLTNYREPFNDAEHPIEGRKSRGAMPTAWLGEPPELSMVKSVEDFVSDGGVKGVGGFSMVCAKLKKKSEGFAVISNRAADIKDVPLVKPDHIKGWGLTNTVFDRSETWPKVGTGVKGFEKVIQAHAANEEASEQELVDELFKHLDTDTLHGHCDRTLEENIDELKNSIFIPAIGDERHRVETKEAQAKGRQGWPTEEELQKDIAINGDAAFHQGFDMGMYGTQRQTIVLVDHDGNVTYIERALYDATGHEIPRGEGDLTFKFKINGWEE